MAMNVETRQMIQLAIGLIGLATFGFLYSLGGRNGSSKALRRYVGSSILFATCLALSVWSGCFSWWMLLALPSLATALTLGYGGEGLPTKLMRRSLYGLCIGLASAPIFLPLGLWQVFLFQVTLNIAVSIFWGVWSRTSAVGEEGLLGTSLVLFWPFVLIR